MSERSGFGFTRDQLRAAVLVVLALVVIALVRRLPGFWGAG